MSFIVKVYQKRTGNWCACCVCSLFVQSGTRILYKSRLSKLLKTSENNPGKVIGLMHALFSLL